MSCKRSLSRLFLVIVAIGLAAAVAREPRHATKIAVVDPTVSNTNGLAIDGYDPVSYFADYTAVRGDEAHSAEYDGVRFLFASKDHRDRFKMDPEKYIPEFGGFSTYGVSEGKLYSADPKVFDIIKGRLYLSRNKKVRELWQRNPDGYIRQADAHWRELNAR